jgi:hypothetical protein
MANKFFLVPSQQFQHMLSVSKDPTAALLASEEPALSESQQKLKRLLKYKSKKGKALSVRKALYDQELGRYIRLRKQRVNRPVKVEVVNKGGAKLIVDPKVQPGGASAEAESSAPNETPTSLPTISPAEVRGEVRSAPLAIPSAQQTPAGAEAGVDGARTTPVARPAARRGRRVLGHALKEGEQRAALAANRDDFTKHLLAKRQELGITEEGEVLKGGKPIKKSNYESIVRTLFASKRKLTANTPKGTWQLLGRIRKDRELNNLFNSYLPQYGGGLYPHRRRVSSFFRPTLWS